MRTAEEMLTEVLDAFDFGNPVVGAKRFGCGHINDTFCVHTQPEDVSCKCFILQRMSSAQVPSPQKKKKQTAPANHALANRTLAASGT